MRLNHILLGCGTSLLSLSVAAAILPDAGQTQQSIDQRPLQLPSKQRLELNLPDAPSSEATVNGLRLHVSDFILQGNSALASTELLALLSDW